MAVGLNQNFGILNGPGALVTTPKGVPKLCQKPFLNVFLPYTKTEEISNVDTKSLANPVRKSQNVAGGVNGNFGILHGPDALTTTPKHCQTHIEVEEISNFDSKSWANPLALKKLLKLGCWPKLLYWCSKWPHVLPNGKHHFNLQQKFTCFAIKRYKYTCSCAFDHIPKYQFVHKK